MPHKPGGRRRTKAPHVWGSVHGNLPPLSPGRGEDFTAVYNGESGDSGYVPTKEHRISMEKRDRSNAFAKYLAECHPISISEPSSFKW